MNLDFFKCLVKLQQNANECLPEHSPTISASPAISMMGKGKRKQITSFQLSGIDTGILMLI